MRGCCVSGGSDFPHRGGLTDLREALALLEAGERDEVMGEIREMVEGEE